MAKQKEPELTSQSWIQIPTWPLSGFVALNEIFNLIFILVIS